MRPHSPRDTVGVSGSKVERWKEELVKTEGEHGLLFELTTTANLEAALHNAQQPADA